MKKLIPVLLSIFILFSPQSLFPQDGWINQVKELNADLYDICSPEGIITWDGYMYWMVGDSGTILKSIGGPFSWSLQESGTNANLRGVYFFPDGKGYCVGEDGICIRTENFGNHWALIPLNTASDLNDIWFINDKDGFIIGDSGVFMVSYDGGNVWNTGTLNSDQNLNKLRQSTSSVIWIVGDSGTVFKATNGGNNWQTFNTGFTGNFNDVYPVDNEYAYIVGDHGLVISTDDGGATWQDFSIPDTTDLYGVCGTYSYDLWICGTNGAMYYKTFVEPTWYAYIGPTGGLNYRSLMYDPEDLLFIFLADSCYYNYLHHYNSSGGINKAGENLYFGPADFVDAQTGFVGGENVTLLHTIDGGEHWYSLHLGDFEGNNHFVDISDVEFIDQLIGWIVVGRFYEYEGHSWIYNTDDGGMTWTQQYASDSELLSCIFFLDQDHGWAGGNGGLVMKTENGGDDWTVIQQVNPDLESVSEIHFNNLEDGYMSRNYGEFLTTHDGGTTWQFIVDFGEMAEDLFVIQDSLIWVLMNFSGLNKSLDGGNSWINLPFPDSNNSPHSIFFLNEHEGWAGGSFQSLWHTNDGGENWNIVYEGTELENYNEMVFADSANGWLIGQYGSIMHGPGLYVDIPENHNDESESILIFPNPAKDKVNLKIRHRIPDLPISLTVFNIIGQQIFYKQIKEASDTFILNVSGYQPGIYLAIFKQGDGIYSSGKFIIVSEK